MSIQPTRQLQNALLAIQQGDFEKILPFASRLDLSFRGWVVLEATKHKLTPVVQKLLHSGPIGAKWWEGAMTFALREAPSLVNLLRDNAEIGSRYSPEDSTEGVVLALEQADFAIAQRFFDHMEEISACVHTLATTLLHLKNYQGKPVAALLQLIHTKGAENWFEEWDGACLWAAKHNRLSLVQEFQRKASAKTRGYALQIASIEGYEEIVESLVQDPSISLKDRLFAVAKAFAQGHIAIAEKVLTTCHPLSFEEIKSRYLKDDSGPWHRDINGGIIIIRLLDNGHRNIAIRLLHTIKLFPEECCLIRAWASVHQDEEIPLLLHPEWSFCPEKGAASIAIKHGFDSLLDELLTEKMLLSPDELFATAVEERGSLTAVQKLLARTKVSKDALAKGIATASNQRHPETLKVLLRHNCTISLPKPEIKEALNAAKAGNDFPLFSLQFNELWGRVRSASKHPSLLWEGVRLAALGYSSILGKDIIHIPREQHIETFEVLLASTKKRRIS